MRTINVLLIVLWPHSESPIVRSKQWAVGIFNQWFPPLHCRLKCTVPNESRLPISIGISETLLFLRVVLWSLQLLLRPLLLTNIPWSDRNFSDKLCVLVRICNALNSLKNTRRICITLPRAGNWLEWLEFYGQYCSPKLPRLYGSLVLRGSISWFRPWLLFYSSGFG